jgi:nucleoside-diphosphate-sugar epimerase
VKALVTGANGFVGRALVGRLLARGVSDIRCFIRLDEYRSRFDGLLQDYPDAKLEFFVGNLLSRDDATAAVEGVDVLYHLAASLKGSPADMFMNTVVTSNNLLAALGENGAVKTVLVSSMGVYGTADLPAGQVIDERTPLEPHPERRDVYSHAKWRQEKLFRDFREQHGLPLVVLRPGVIYGPGGSPMSARVGLNLFGLFLHVGGSSVIPLTYVDNCADAIAVASLREDAVGEAFNVVDDDLPTSRQYLRQYRRNVERLKFVRIPYGVMEAVSRAVKWYNKRSQGQLPAVFTPYKTASLWKGMHFSNEKLKGLGWEPAVPTRDGLERTFAYLRGADGGRAH